jgi:hypothetical protein
MQGRLKLHVVHLSIWMNSPELVQDMERQALNVFRMRLMGAEVRPVYSGTATLKDATSEAIRDWVGRTPASRAVQHHCSRELGSSRTSTHPTHARSSLLPPGDQRGDHPLHSWVSGRASPLPHDGP